MASTSSGKSKTSTATPASTAKNTPNAPSVTEPQKESIATMGHPLMITLAVEMLGVGLFALLAGIDRDAGKVMVTIMGGLWLIYAITNDKVITGLGNALDKATNGEG